MSVNRRRQALEFCLNATVVIIIQIGSGVRTESWTKREEEVRMYTKEQEETALAEFALTGSVYRVIQRLGYPSKSTLYRWLKHKQAGLENWHGTT